MKRRILTALILCAMLFSVSSCGESETDKTENNGADTPSSEVAEQVEEETKALHDLPKDLNFEGESIRFLYRTEVIDEFYATETTGEVVNDETFGAFAEMESYLDLKTEVTELAGQFGDDRNTYMDTIKNNVTAGDDTWDWCDAMFGFFPNMVVNGTFRDISNLEYIDYGKPYYISGLSEVADLNGKLYFLAGDSSLGYLKNIYCLVYNTDLAENIGIDEDIGQLALDGGWTSDKLNTLAEAAYIDLNGDGNVDTGDLLGYYERNWLHRQGFLYGYGSEMIQKIDGEYKFVYGTELDVGIVEAVNKLTFNTKGSMVFGATDADGAYASTADGFMNGTVLFMTAELREVEAFRDMEDDFLVLPIPKYNEEQESYISSSRNTHSAFGMPVTCKNTAKAGAAMEFISAVRYERVVPAYYEKTMKTKVSRSTTAISLLELIKNSMKMDIGYTYNAVIGYPINNLYIWAIQTPDTFISGVEAARASTQKQLDDYIETLNGLPE